MVSYHNWIKKQPQRCTYNTLLWCPSDKCTLTLRSSFEYFMNVKKGLRWDDEQYYNSTIGSFPKHLPMILYVFWNRKVEVSGWMNRKDMQIKETLSYVQSGEKVILIKTQNYSISWQNKIQKDRVRVLSTSNEQDRQYWVNGNWELKRRWMIDPLRDI